MLATKDGRRLTLFLQGTIRAWTLRSRPSLLFCMPLAPYIVDRCARTTSVDYQGQARTFLKIPGMAAHEDEPLSLGKSTGKMIKKQDTIGLEVLG